jgi:hypothetical protein
VEAVDSTGEEAPLADMGGEVGPWRHALEVPRCMCSCRLVRERRQLVVRLYTDRNDDTEDAA